MAPDEPVPDADRQEQEAPVALDQRDAHPVPPDAPAADVFEQELPVVDSGGDTGIDAERTEPVSDDDWEASGS